jgi:hypothetical protein
MKALRLLGIAGMTTVVLGTAGCPGPEKSYIPVDSPLRQWQKPDIASESSTPAPEPPKKPEKKGVK